MARKREKYQEMFATDVMSLEELKTKVARLEARKTTVERELAALNNDSERVESLRWLHDRIADNPIITLLTDSQKMRRGYYRGLELRVETDGEDVTLFGAFGENVLDSAARTSTSVTQRSRRP